MFSKLGPVTSRKSSWPPGHGPALAQWTGHGPEQARRRSPSDGTPRAGTMATRSPAQRRIAESGVDRDPDRVWESRRADRHFWARSGWCEGERRPPAGDPLEFVFTARLE